VAEYFAIGLTKYKYHARLFEARPILPKKMVGSHSFLHIFTIWLERDEFIIFFLKPNTSTHHPLV
jgi:hypothetical protein